MKKGVRKSAALTAEGAVERDLLAGVHKAMTTSASTMVPGSLAIPAVYWWSANRIGLVIGMAIALAVSLPALSFLKRLDVGTHRNPTRALALANGAANGIWALLPIWMMPSQVDDQYLVIALPFAMLVTNLAATAAVRTVYLAGQVPLTLASIVAFAVFADGNVKWAAAVIAVTVLTLDGLAGDWHQTAHRNALLQHNNDLLVADLEAANVVLEHQSRHDSLTGLLNRRAFGEFIEAVPHRDQAPAIMLIDLDSFKAVNDQHGHHYGDELLTLVAARLRTVAPEAAVSRLGGDEFAIAWHDAPSLSLLLEVADRVNAALRTPFTVESKPVVISASIGLADGGESLPSADVLRHADEALYLAKASGRDRAVAYDAESLGGQREALGERRDRFGHGIDSA